LALGAEPEARDTLRYLSATQIEDGHWQQNQWLGGRPFWEGIQLDETAFPVLLAAALDEREALAGIEVEDMVRRALGYIARTGPATEQDRWEEAPESTPSRSLSPSPLWSREPRCCPRRPATAASASRSPHSTWVACCLTSGSILPGDGEKPVRGRVEIIESPSSRPISPDFRYAYGRARTVIRGSALSLPHCRRGGQHAGLGGEGSVFDALELPISWQA
jgi:hypothetical protein